MFTLLLLILEVQSGIVYVNETVRYSLTDLFGYLENPTYEITDAQNPYLSIIPQYSMHPDTKTHNQNADIIISAKAQIQQGYWTNHFLFLELNKGSYNLHYSENPQEENVATPKFNEHLMVTNSASDVCFDAEQYDDTHYIVDCAIKTDGQPLQNKFLVISKEQVVKTHPVSNPQKYQTIQKRKISTFYVEEQLYLLQGSIQNGVESIIQIYQINSADISFLEQEHEISTSVLKIILGLDDSYKFYLLDFKLVYSYVYFLDKTFVCALSFDKNGDMFLNYYKQLTGNVIAFDYTYYLDDNGVKNSILVILKDKTFDLYYNELDVVTYQLQSTVSANAQIKVSHQFILIEDENTLYQYKIDNKVLLNKKTLVQVNHYLINPIYPDIISISYNLTRRYYITEGYLQLQSQTTSTDPKTINIKATSKSESKDYQFPLQILNKNDGQMYQNGRSKQIITDVISNPGQTQTVIPFVSSPDIEIGADPQDNPLNLEFEIKQEMHIKEWPNPTTIHFQDMLEFSGSLVYVLFQLKTKEVQIWECTQTYQGLTESCKLDVTTTFPILTNQLHFQWWIDNQQAYLIFCDSNYTAELWKLDQNNTLTKINKIISLTPITQILELHRTLYILIGQDKKIGVYNSNDAMKIDSIDEKTVKSLGMIKNWSPKRLFGNQKYSSHLLFIQNNDNLMVTIYNNQINLVENIAITDDIEITLYKNTFFMSRISQGNSILEEYSIKDLNDIYLMRQVQLYGYEFHSPLTVTQSEDNGFLFILAKTQQVLLFRPNEENSNDELFRVFNIQFSDFATMSACGFKKTHFYFSNGTDSSYFAILMQPTLYVKSLVSVPTEDYFTNITQSLYFKNEHFQLNFGEIIQILNRDQKFTVLAQNITVLEGKSSYMEPINNLYTGQVVSLTCDNCNSQIQLITPLQVVSTKFLENVKDIEYYSVNYNAAITKDKLYLVDHQENVQEVFSFGSPNSCEYLQVQQNFTYVTVLCNYNNIYHMYLIICDLSFHCSSQDTPKDLSALQGVSKMILLPDNLILIQDMGKILVYNIQIQETTWTITQTQTIDTGKGLTDFTVQEYDVDKKHYYILSMIDQADNLNIFYTEYQGAILNILSQSSILIYNIILDSKQFAFQTTDYIQLFAISQTSQELNYIIIANDVASVAIQVFLNETNQIKSATVTQVFNPYLDWIALKKAVYLDNSLIVPYSNKVDTLLAFYNVNSSKATPNFIYGLKDTVFSVTDGLFINYLFSNSVTHLYSNLVNKVMTSYEVRSCPQVLFSNTSNLQTTQNITWTADNIQNKQSINVTINKQSVPPPPPPPPDDDNTSGSNWWWITLIVVGCVVIIGVGVFLYMKHKQIGLFKVEGAGYSLHGVA